MTRPSDLDSTRRAFVRGLGGGVVMLSAAPWLSACAPGEIKDPPEVDPSDTDGVGPATDLDPTDVDTDVTDVEQVEAWATGGTAAMTGAAAYPNPFASGLADPSCALTCLLTLGPCYAPSAPVRQDVSEGEAGIPLRLYLRVVDADGCAPVAGAEVEIWHCNIEGLYSGEDVNRVQFCTGGDERAEAAYFSRGRAIADADGVLFFDATFPGAYPGRAIHIHFLVRRAEDAGGVQDDAAAVVSQVFFPDALTREIFAEVPGYQERGQPDTTLETDGVTRSVDDLTPYILDYRRMDDGAMLAWKTLAISEDERC
jgi:protocatechuate 3,4-dioxygenase beta subunit